MGEYTPILGLYKPVPGERNWGGNGGQAVSDNFQTIEDEWDTHDELKERTAGHGVQLQSRLETEVADLDDAIGDRLKQLMMLYGGI